MNEGEDIEQILKAILDRKEAEWQNLCEALIGKYTPDALYKLAEQLKLQTFDRLLHTDLEQARQIARFLHRLGEGAQHQRISGLGLLAQSDTALHSGQAHSARDLFQQAGEVFRQAGDRIGWARARGGWVVAATYAGLIKENDLIEMDKIRQVLHDAGPAYLYRQAIVEQNIGLAWKHLGHFQEALGLFDQALATLGPGTTPAELELRGMLLANTAVVRLWTSDLAGATSLFQQARTLFLERKSGASVAMIDMNLSIIERLRGHWRQTLLLLQTAIHGLREANRPMQLALALIYQTEMFLTLNRTEEASASAAEAVALLRELDDPIDLHSAYGMQARALYQCGNEAGALACLLEGEKLTAQVRDLYIEYPLPLERAFLLLSCGNAAEAKEVALTFLKSPDTEETRLHRQRALLLAAEATLAMGNLTLARSMTREVIKQGEEFGVPELLYRGHLVLARAAYQTGDLLTALEHFDTVTSTLYTLQDDLVYDQRAEFLQDKDVLFLEALLVALEQGNTLKAFAYLEQRRTRSHWRIFPQREEDVTQTGHPVSELEALLARHRVLSEAMLLQPANSPDLDGAKRELKLLVRDIRELQGAQAQKEATAIPLDERDILHTIPQGETVLAYALAQDDLVIFVISRSHILATRFPGGVRQLHTLARYLDLLVQTTTAMVSKEQHWQGTLQKLWSLLIAPVARHLPPAGETLTIIPSGLLYTVPWSALYDGEGYLAERWELHCVPSCQALGRRPAPNSETSLLALGYSSKGQLQLPGVPVEAHNIADLMEGEAWVEEEASGKHLQQAGAGRTLLHIAAHAAFRVDLPHSSYLQLADGPFHPTDVLTLNLRGCRLVTLSACRTGLGRPGGGDEQIGLTGAFHLAGAEAVLATLWRVDDASTLTFMREFYRRIAGGFSLTTALRGAHLAFLQDSLTAHPYLWAGFQLITYVGQESVEASPGASLLPSTRSGSG
jgi:CHAT domain-containing protein